MFDIHGTHRVDSLVSGTNQKLALGINSEVGFFSVFSSLCTMCDVTNKYVATNNTIKLDSTHPQFDAYTFDPKTETL